MQELIRVAVFLGICSHAVGVDAFDWSGKTQREIRELNSAKVHLRLKALARLGKYSIKHSRQYILRAMEDIDPRVQQLAASLAVSKGIVEAGPLLMQWLSHWDENMRLAAAEGLGKLGDPAAVKSLVRALEDPEPKVRLGVAQALGQLKTKDNQEVVALLGRIRDTNIKVRQAVVEVLGTKKDRRSVIPLISCLGDTSGDVRLAAVSALREIGDPGSGPALARLTRDSNPEVASAAVESLGQLRYLGATEALIDLVRTGSRELRQAAARALGSMGTPQAIDALVDSLFSPSIRSAAKDALIQAGDRASHRLVQMLKDPRVPQSVAIAAVEIASKARLRSTVPSLIYHLRLGRLPKTLLIKALGSTGDPRAQRPLLELLTHTSTDICLTALFALDSLMDERAAEPLQALLTHPNRMIRKTAITYLGKIRAKNATSALSRVAQGKDLRLARLAVTALSLTRDPRAVSPLIKLLQHKDRTIRRLASQALARIKEPSSITPILQICRRILGAPRITCLQALAGVLRGKTDENALAFLGQIIASDDRSSFFAALDALAAMEDKRIAGMLIKRYPAVESNLKRRILDALGNFQVSPNAVSPLLLKEMDHEDPSLRSAATWALGKLHNPQHLHRLKQAARDRSWMVRANAVAALARLGLKSTQELMRAMALDPIAYVRANALLGLAWSSAHDSIGLLAAKLRNDRSPWVRINALRALVHLSPSRRAVIPIQDVGIPLSSLVDSVAREDPDPRVRLTAGRIHRQRHEHVAGSKGWIGLYLLDQQRKPLRNTSFILVTPSGLIKAAFSNSLGEAFEEGLKEGQCYAELTPVSLGPKATSKN